eukprot:scaffold196766_cov17-Prasinocladus_malaysianus.AAC.1
MDKWITWACICLTLITFVTYSGPDALIRTSSGGKNSISFHLRRAPQSWAEHHSTHLQDLPVAVASSNQEK